jgi:DNA polymerase I
MSQKTCMLVDASNILYRSYHAAIASAERESKEHGIEIKPLQTSDGFPTGALYGWFRTLIKMQEDYNPDLMVAVFDYGKPKSRLEVLPDYKGNRKPRDPELTMQMREAYEKTELFGIPVIRKEETEADDIIFSLSRLWQGERVLIVGDDKDLGQCINDKVHQLKSPRMGTQGWRRFDKHEIVKSYGIEPEQIPDYLALTGDSADNIPGMPGVGDVTARKWLNLHRDIDGIISNAHSIEPRRFRDVIAENQEKLKGFLGITRLHSIDVEMPSKIETNHTELVQYLESREMKSLAYKYKTLAKTTVTKQPPVEEVALAGGSKQNEASKATKVKVEKQLPEQGMLF